MTQSAHAAPLVLLKGITKTFPGVVANRDIDLEVSAGEIHALLGENGAGKSTLMNILTGIYQPDAGEIFIAGERRTLAGPADAIAAGIGMVHQHFKLVRTFTVAENVHLGWQRTPRVINRDDLAQRTTELARSLGLAVRPLARIDDLSTAEQQRVEILRVLAREVRVLILDEPTAVLAPAEALELFKTLKSFVARGNAVIFISHKLDEVLAISDRVTVLRGGRKLSTHTTRDTSAGALTNQMLGHEALIDTVPRHANRPERPTYPVLSLHDVVVKDAAGEVVLERVSLELQGGEILGIAGVSGEGQQELSEVLTGMRAASAGEIRLGGVDFSTRNAREFAEFGVGHIPEDRLQTGLAPALSITENAVMREYRWPPVASGWWFRPWRARVRARALCAAAQVRMTDVGLPVGNLSGGNQQKLIAHREMRVATKVLIAAYPGRGMDVGAVDALMNDLGVLRDRGVGVILISEEIEELLRVCDRIGVLFRGAMMGFVDTRHAPVETIGLMMAGQRAATAASLVV